MSEKEYREKCIKFIQDERDVNNSYRQCYTLVVNNKRNKNLDSYKQYFEYLKYKESAKIELENFFASYEDEDLQKAVRHNKSDFKWYIKGTKQRINSFFTALYGKHSSALNDATIRNGYWYKKEIEDYEKSRR